MSKRHDARERRKQLRRTFAYEGPRYTVQRAYNHEPPQLLLRHWPPAEWYAVWDQETRQQVGEPFGTKELAAKEASALNERDR